MQEGSKTKSYGPIWRAEVIIEGLQKSLIAVEEI